MKLSDIQLLFWTTSIEADTFELENMEKENKKIKSEIQNITSDIQDVEERLKKGKEELAKNVTISRTRSVNEIFQVMNPGLIYERKITDGFRMHCMHHNFINTARNPTTNEYGIQISKFNSLSDFSFIPLHSAQIRDISSNNLDIITCSLDKTLRITSSSSQKPISRIDLSIPLWSCTTVNSNLIGAGGDRGFFTIIDQRTNKAIVSKNIPGPPVNSMSTLNPTTVMCLTAKNLHFYDISKGDFVSYQKEESGGFSLQHCDGTSFYSILSRKNDEGLITYKALDQNKVFSTFSQVRIGMFRNLIRPSIYCYGDSIYSAIPNEPSGDFSFYALSLPNYDMWGNWKRRWIREGRREPVIDCLICEERGEFIIASLACDRLCMYSVPPFIAYM